MAKVITSPTNATSTRADIRLLNLKHGSTSGATQHGIIPDITASAPISEPVDQTPGTVTDTNRITAHTQYAALCYCLFLAGYNDGVSLLFYQNRTDLYIECM